eukprot:CAMPEP_0172451348 /NCGR_PEP_ID=MMETSP1065-20121228/9431_1 /TAXON_ID=265537 /ORGANISM="Amphiprora paludosa, Strain CCMP125" /LENGTH=762 /DNA_ID=CAMNT_0013203299 /DNA_START=73 /DNA_END=2361 /DNA_ORIENTATION=+
MSDEPSTDIPPPDAAATAASIAATLTTTADSATSPAAATAEKEVATADTPADTDKAAAAAAEEPSNDNKKRSHSEMDDEETAETPAKTTENVAAAAETGDGTASPEKETAKDAEAPKDAAAAAPSDATAEAAPPKRKRKRGPRRKPAPPPPIPESGLTTQQEEATFSLFFSSTAGLPPPPPPPPEDPPIGVCAPENGNNNNEDDDGDTAVAIVLDDENAPDTDPEASALIDLAAAAVEEEEAEAGNHALPLALRALKSMTPREAASTNLSQKPGERLPVKLAILSAYDLAASVQDLERVDTVDWNSDMALHSFGKLLQSQREECEAILNIEFDKLMPFEQGLMWLTKYRIQYQGSVQVPSTQTLEKNYKRELATTPPTHDPAIMGVPNNTTNDGSPITGGASSPSTAPKVAPYKQTVEWKASVFLKNLKLKYNKDFNAGRKGTHVPTSERLDREKRPMNYQQFQVRQENYKLLKDALGIDIGATATRMSMGSAPKSATKATPKSASTHTPGASATKTPTNATPREGGASAQKLSWEEHFQNLVEFQAEHGHANVPQAYGKLGVWLSGQRKAYNMIESGRANEAQSKRCAFLTAERIERMEALGVKWRLRKGRPRKGDPNYRNKRLGIGYDTEDATPGKKQSTNSAQHMTHPDLHIYGGGVERHGDEEEEDDDADGVNEEVEDSEEEEEEESEEEEEVEEEEPEAEVIMERQPQYPPQPRQENYAQPQYNSAAFRAALYHQQQMQQQQQQQQQHYHDNYPFPF